MIFRCKKTHIDEGAAAVVFNADTGFDLLIPKMDDDELVPANVATVTALATLLLEDGFCQQIADRWTEMEGLYEETGEYVEGE